MQSENIGYEIGEWYMVEIAYQVYIPAKFIGINRGCDVRNDFFHNFPHPGKAIFENVKPHSNSCGFDGDKMENGKGFDRVGRGYTDFKPKFRLVTEKELWAVKAIEEFQKVIAGRKQTFSIVMNNGWKFEGKVKPPGKKDNFTGKYWAYLVNKNTGEEKKGEFDYDGKSESVYIFLNSKLSPDIWHLHTLKFKGEIFGLKQESD